MELISWTENWQTADISRNRYYPFWYPKGRIDQKPEKVNDVDALKGTQ